jgi:diguanylate cyclase (GGDEF)-like protein
VQLQIQIDARTLDLQEANARLDQLAGTDELTGAYNRRRFLDLAHRAVQRAHATQRPLSMVLIDLDDFKLVNDTYGHLAGDAVIRASMNLTASLCRGSDLVGRYGGEELILCLPDSDADGAWQLTERIRRALADTSVTDDGHDIMITASAGIAVLRPGEDLQTMLRRADDALYAAKNGGRNRSQLDAR